MKKLLIPSLLLLSAGCTQQQGMERQVAEAEQIIVEKEQENVELQTALDQINTALLQVQDTLKTEQARNDAFSTRVVELELEKSQLLGRVAALENAEIENSRLQGRISGLEATTGTQAGVIEELRLQVSQKEQSVTEAEARISNQRLLIEDLLGERGSLIQSVQNLTAAIPMESGPVTVQARGNAQDAIEYFEVELDEYQSMKGNYVCTPRPAAERTAGRWCEVRILDGSYNEVMQVSLERFLFEPPEPDTYTIEVTIGCAYWGCGEGNYSIEITYTTITEPPDESAFRTIPICSADSTYHRQSDGNWICQSNRGGTG